MLRRPVDIARLADIVRWMDTDRDIVYFNSDVTAAVCVLELDRYPGYRRLPAGNRYTLNLQAAVWRTANLPPTGSTRSAHGTGRSAATSDRRPPAG